MNSLIQFTKWFFKLSNQGKIKQISKGEQQCSKILKELYPHHEFKTSRPNFMRNPMTGRNLELDLYNAELKLAIEYNGIQHYMFSKYFHRTESDFLKQKSRDKLKKRLCRKHGVKLIVVPYTIPFNNIKTFIIKEINSHNTQSKQCIII